jgi:hypothetical protein
MVVPYQHKHLLRHRFRTLPIPRDVERQTEHLPAIPIVQGAERVLIALGDHLEQGVIPQVHAVHTCCAWLRTVVPT